MKRQQQNVTAASIDFRLSGIHTNKPTIRGLPLPRPYPSPPASTNVPKNKEPHHAQD
ncbi:hypothetical protein PHYBLDRAFT_152926 [Phycomyces blakesleeanus NRRL 1555(-)]|uniref:Uncharacterized protein n=1 Tax=Phycomyces blakesleeanus (strain ATCC 8743b / DSM 1359 / FGSC 10004 / NBRC 33097 / NRRL 1555) TaxID=763407 RepID=A0A163CVJ4_PHYB8|nr:hypothetical protein PHYBLDRAFT_152926 [Phycomyces blakesleeanus NRRL 1555(-)]OAD65900.1 hypothetical protein PHYBLDRAFT_152926 [Phycomyces blakesleeanus NRRL 1555(-)]|eukprot:XP_018283940.1 hypothetical protein PHYBLDRAFT_152926 [Phycomyces blakesleeanus NRRL 1555(-)]